MAKHLCPIGGVGIYWRGSTVLCGAGAAFRTPKQVTQLKRLIKGLVGLDANVTPVRYRTVEYSHRVDESDCSDCRVALDHALIAKLVYIHGKKVKWTKRGESGGRVDWERYIELPSANPILKEYYGGPIQNLIYNRNPFLGLIPHG